MLILFFLALVGGVAVHTEGRYTEQDKSTLAKSNETTPALAYRVATEARTIIQNNAKPVSITFGILMATMAIGACAFSSDPYVRWKLNHNRRVSMAPNDE